MTISSCRTLVSRPAPLMFNAILSAFRFSVASRGRYTAAPDQGEQRASMARSTTRLSKSSFVLFVCFVVDHSSFARIC